MIEHFHHMLAEKPLANLDRQRLAAEHIDHCQHAELLPVAELVVEKVQAPRLVRSLRYGPCLPVQDHLAPHG